MRKKDIINICFILSLIFCGCYIEIPKEIGSQNNGNTAEKKENVNEPVSGLDEDSKDSNTCVKDDCERTCTTDETCSYTRPFNFNYSGVQAFSWTEYVVLKCHNAVDLELTFSGTSSHPLSVFLLEKEEDVPESLLQRSNTGIRIYNVPDKNKYKVTFPMSYLAKSRWPDTAEIVIISDYNEKDTYYETDITVTSRWVSCK